MRPAGIIPGRSGRLRLGPTVLATFGELHPAALAALDIESVVAGFELDLDALPKSRAKPGKTRPALEPWPYPPVDRDFAFVVDEAVSAEALVKAIRQAEKKLIRDVQVFDVFRGPGLEAGKKSVAVAIRLQSRERTLAEAEVEPAAARIVAAVTTTLGGRLRS